MSKRWRIFACLSLMYVLAYFYRVSMAVMAKDLEKELGLSAAQLGTLSGAFFYAFAVTQLPLGLLLDRHGGKKVVVLTGLITLAGVLVFALSTGYGTALAGRILIGIGSASVLMGALKVFTNWFDHREFGRVSGFIIAVGNLGNLSATAPLAWAIARFGWRATYLSVAVLQLLCLAAVQRLVAERPAHPPHHDIPGKDHPAPDSPLAGLRQVLATPSYWLMSALAFFWYANYMAVQGLWGGPYLMEVVGVGREGAGNILLATSLGFLVGCLFVGRVADSWLRSRKKTLVAGQLALVLCMSLFLGPADHLSTPLLAGAMFLMGLAVSSGVAIYPLIRERFSHGITGTAMTAVNFFILLGAATGQQVMGLYIGRFPKGVTGYPPAAYHGAFLIPICGLAMALLLFLFAKDSDPVESSGR
ncbi:MAG: major facilitator family [Geobacteraceae bacterium]|nr:MAG: major facilitator family [Geobacteraceae bacterium]